MLAIADISHIRPSSSKLKLFSHSIEILTNFHEPARAIFGGSRYSLYLCSVI